MEKIPIYIVDSANVGPYKNIKEESGLLNDVQKFLIHKNMAFKEVRAGKLGK